MKTLKYILLGALLPMVCTSCDDYFDPENKTVLDGNSYIKEQSELYSGYLGVINKLQDVGDKSIYLTDTRAEMLEPTGNNDELLDIYNYEPDLSGNSYADPAKYYDLLIACNDFLYKAKTYKDAHSESVDMDHYRGLVSCVVRLKAWTCFTLAKIYGEVAWFDDPMLAMQDVSSLDIVNLDEALDRCADLLETGYDGVDGKHTMDWAEWITSVNADDASAGDYYYWGKMVPDYFVLAADIALWRGEYQRVVDLIMPAMHEVLLTTDLRSGQVTWLCAGSYGSSYPRLFDNTNPTTLATVNVILYDYANGQRNYLIHHFYNEYMLRPSQAGMDFYSNPEFNPLKEGTVDGRLAHFVAEKGGKYYFHKYRKLSGSYRDNPLQDDVHIYLYRSVDLYFMLAEAFNHLRQSEVSHFLINQGVNTKWKNNMRYDENGEKIIFGFPCDALFDEWTANPKRGGRSYPDSGIRGTKGDRDIYIFDTLKTYTDEEALAMQLHNDLEILEERLLEQPGEGKTYEAMRRLARRYNDFTIMTRYICPKYNLEPQGGKNDSILIHNRIVEQNGFVPWDLKSKSSVH